MKLGGATLYITVDRLGASRCAGGLCMTAMDLALRRPAPGRGRRAWCPTHRAGGMDIDNITTAGDPDAWLEGRLFRYFPARPMY